MSFLFSIEKWGCYSTPSHIGSDAYACCMLLVTLLQIDKLGLSWSKEWIYCLYFLLSSYFFKTVELNVDNVLKKLTQHGFSATKWHDLAASLGQGSAVDEINADIISGGSSAKRNALIKHWLDNDGEPSWKKLVIAMEWSKQRVAAEKLARDIGIPYPVKE